MQSERQLRLLVQATGLYFMAHSIFNLLSTVTRLIMNKVFAPPDTQFFVPTDLRLTLFNGLVYAALLLLPAWLLLAKTDWFTHAISEMSRPRNTFEDDTSPVD